MEKRFVYIWFRHLTSDQLTIRKPELCGQPFVLATPERGRMVIKAVNSLALVHGIEMGMVLADARALLPSLQVFEDNPLRAGKLLRALAEWCLRYTPLVAVDEPDGLIFDITGCAHLWGGERSYLKDILERLRGKGYNVRAGVADTIGTAWAISRFGQISPIIERGCQAEALKSLPPMALRLDKRILERMHKLGFHQIHSFMDMPRTTLRRRFGEELTDRLDQALGFISEPMTLVQPFVPYQERLPCLEPTRTATGIQIALRKLLEMLCQRLLKEGKGIRKGIFKGYRTDGHLEQIEIGTHIAVRNVDHLFKLFELKIATIRPSFGIELFLLEAPVVEDLSQQQETLWATAEKGNTVIAGLLDRIEGRFGANVIHRYLPDEHHWPERSIRAAISFQEKPSIAWPKDQPRPVCLLHKPEPIQVTSPLPDYPPMLFVYQNKIHKIKKADGPERIEREWWIEKGLQRDYYCVEDEEGARYWVFRSGRYEDHEPEWFLHGFFA
jgi:protein ImuB